MSYQLIDRDGYLAALERDENRPVYLIDRGGHVLETSQLGDYGDTVRCLTGSGIEDREVEWPIKLIYPLDLSKPIQPVNGDTEGCGMDSGNRKFIAHARTDVPALVAALEAVVKDCQEIISDWDAEPVPDEFENGKALHAGDLLDLINQHLTIGDKQ